MLKHVMIRPGGLYVGEEKIPHFPYGLSVRAYLKEKAIDYLATDGEGEMQRGRYSDLRRRRICIAVVLDRALRIYYPENLAAL